MIGTETITVTPRTGSWSAGVYTPVDGTPYTLKASVQPVGPRTVEMLPEAARTAARFNVWIAGATQRVNVTSPAMGYPGDVLTIRGREYVAIASEDHSGHRRGLPHQVVTVAEVGHDEVSP